MKYTYIVTCDSDSDTDYIQSGGNKREHTEPVKINLTIELEKKEYDNNPNLTNIILSVIKDIK